MRTGGNDCGRVCIGVCVFLVRFFFSTLYWGFFGRGGAARVFFPSSSLGVVFFSFLFSRAFLNWEFFFFFSFVFAVFFFFIGVLRWRGGFSSGRAMVLTFFFFFH